MGEWEIQIKKIITYFKRIREIQRKNREIQIKILENQTKKQLISEIQI
jgi:hypothetical protein